jgi:hypothetical protein
LVTSHIEAAIEKPAKAEKDGNSFEGMQGRTSVSYKTRVNYTRGTFFRYIPYLLNIFPDFDILTTVLPCQNCR